MTGQEKKLIPSANHTAMTVEMLDVRQEYDCAVIDEIQMMSSSERGSSFTRALLGVAAKEVHLCGEPSAVKLIQKLLSPTQDKVEIRRYDRLSPLNLMTKALRSFTRVNRGDCVVAFSRREIYSIKKEIEESSKWRCCVVYGSLPPETRTLQASQFNDSESGYDILVASDAVGMGLNLNIRRIVFSTLKKFDGTSLRKLTSPEVKQIAGRAGRYKSCFPEGEVTCLKEEDMGDLYGAMRRGEEEDRESAGLFPSFDQLALYSSQFPFKSFSEILEEFVSAARLSPNYFMRNCTDMLRVAVLLEKLPDLSFSERFVFCQSPVDVDDPNSMGALLRFAKQYSEKGEVRLEERLTPGTVQIPRTQKALVDLETWHKVLDLYLWLGLRFEDSFFHSPLAVAQKEICNFLIQEGLKALETKKVKKKEDNFNFYQIGDFKGSEVYRGGRKKSSIFLRRRERKDGRGGEEEEEEMGGGGVKEEVEEENGGGEGERGREVEVEREGEEEVEGGVGRVEGRMERLRGVRRRDILGKAGG